MSILIGLIDQEIGNNDSFSWETSKIGGFPKWINSEKSDIKTDCKSCGQPLSLVTQIYCPLNGSSYHRCLYVFICSRRECNKQQKGWQVFRSQLYDSTYENEAEMTTNYSQSDLSKDNWIDDQNDWGDEPGESLTDTLSHQLPDDDDKIGPYSKSLCKHETDSCEVALSQLKMKGESIETNNKDQAQTEKAFTSHAEACRDATDPCIIMEEIDLPDSQRLSAIAEFLNTEDKLISGNLSVPAQLTPIAFKSYYLCVIEEPPEVSTVDVHVEDLIRKYEQDEGKHLGQLLKERPGKHKSFNENYEKTELKHGDKIFHKFLKRLQRCPEQVIRYDRGGEPLLISKTESFQSVSNCSYCGSPKKFELQLLPSLIPWLKTEMRAHVEVEFGTVMIYTCENNCWPFADDPSCQLNLLEESVILLDDPDHQFFR
ncbi:programmed cell death protein [Bulinus truncatus]|nr:programmed cell death protein [Bulinus truncatus]